MKIETKNGNVEIYAETIEQEAISQIYEMSNSPIGKNANIRIMPDCHAGKGCVIGTTMWITDKVCPNLVGVDIGCGVDLVGTDLDFSTIEIKEKLDKVIREHIPYGMNSSTHKTLFKFDDLRCWKHLKKETQEMAYYALGTLGGGVVFLLYLILVWDIFMTVMVICE